MAKSNLGALAAPVAKAPVQVNPGRMTTAAHSPMQQRRSPQAKRATVVRLTNEQLRRIREIAHQREVSMQVVIFEALSIAVAKADGRGPL